MRVAAVGLSGQMHSSVFLDARGSVIRPALEEIYKQTGEFLVRRVLAYVVPHPGEPQAPGPTATAQRRAGVAASMK